MGQRRLPCPFGGEGTKEGCVLMLYSLPASVPVLSPPSKVKTWPVA